MIKFSTCETCCPRRKAMIDVLSKGYFPSSPVRTSFVIAEDVIRFFHLMYMKGPSSKHTFCHAFQQFVKFKTLKIIRILELYKSFLNMYSA